MDDMKEREGDLSGLQQMSFVDAWCAGLIRDELEQQLADYVDVWHNTVQAPGDPPLHEFLGFTWQQYTLWLERHMSLKDLLNYIKRLRELEALAAVNLTK